MVETWEFVGIVSLRLFASLACGAVVGFERKRRAKKAGIRTHCLVALGAAIFGIVSKYGFLDVLVEGPFRPSVLHSDAAFMLWVLSERSA